MTRISSKREVKGGEGEGGEERKKKRKREEGTSSLGKQDAGHPGNSCSAE